MEPTFFKTAVAFNKWLDKNHSSKTEILIGFYKVSAKEKGITYKEALHEALCYGWIDGIRKNFDEISYTIRFTPRKAKSIWSNINIKYVEELLAAKRMQPAGIATFNKRSENKSGIYSYEQNKITRLEESLEKKFKKNKKAWEWFSKQAPSYQRTACFWVMNSKRQETVLKRLENLISVSENGMKLDQYRWGEKKN